MKDKTAGAAQVQNPFGFWYFLGVIGSAVYFVQQVNGFWPVVLALLKSLVWPAFMVYELFAYLAR